MRLSPLWIAPLMALLALPVHATEPKPEIERPAATPQAVGARHTLRTIPEACVRIEGMFTGEAADPYRFTVVRTSPRCRPRARFVDAAEAQPGVAGGWIFNDAIRVPSAACPSREAVVEIWRKPVAAAKPELDAQGAARIYLEDAKSAAAAGEIGAIPVYTATMSVEGDGCG